MDHRVQNSSFTATWLCLAAPADEMRPKLTSPTVVLGLPRLTALVTLNDSNLMSARTPVRHAERLLNRDVEIEVAWPANQVFRRIAVCERRIGHECAGVEPLIGRRIVQPPLAAPRSADPCRSSSTGSR